MNWKLTDHLQLQLEERKIAIAMVFQTLENPDEVVKGKRSRLIYHKLFADKLMRVVTEKSSVITVYITNKVKKYYQRGLE